MSALADVLLHAESSLSRGERELIAAYVSALNDCEFCHHSHAAVASCHLGDEGSTVTAVVRDAFSAPVSPKMKALLSIAARVQRNGRDVRESDIARARTEGATDVEIHDAVLIAAAFCMFNRYVDGLATLSPDDQSMYMPIAATIAEHGYGGGVGVIADRAR